MSGSGDPWLNVTNAIHAAEDVWKFGGVPFVPHLHTTWHMIHPKTHEQWLEFDFAWVRACDALYRLRGESPGAELEVALARKLRKVVLLTHGGMIDYLLTHPGAKVPWLGEEK